MLFAFLSRSRSLSRSQRYATHRYSLSSRRCCCCCRCCLAVRTGDEKEKANLASSIVRRRHSSNGRRRPRFPPSFPPQFLLRSALLSAVQASCRSFSESSPAPAQDYCRSKSCEGQFCMVGTRLSFTPEKKNGMFGPAPSSAEMPDR